jgi:hypothetical protein
MARTEIDSSQVKNVGRSDLDITTAGNSVIRKLIASARVVISSFTGTDSGTGDVTVDLAPHYYSPIHDLAAGSAVDWANGNVQKKSPSGNTTFTFSNGVAGGRYALVITRASAGQTDTWPAAVKWSGGTVPTPSGNGKKDVFTFLYDGTDYIGSATLNH